MRVSVFKKILAYFLDAIPILFVLSMLLSLFVGDLLKDPYPDYEYRLTVYRANVDYYYDTLDEYYQDLTDEIITEAEYKDLSEVLREEFTVVNEDAETMIFSYYSKALLFYLISFISIKYLYTLLMKGQTLGIQLLKLEMVGRINWFSLLIREVFWKEIYWIFTFSIGLWVDLAMVMFTKKRKTFRDIFSDTQIIHQGTSYPF